MQKKHWKDTLNNSSEECTTYATIHQLTNHDKNKCNSSRVALLQ